MFTTAISSKTPISWKRNLAVIWFAEFVAIAGFTVVIPLLPLYVRELDVGDERAVRLWAGAIFSVQAVTMAIFAPIWGALSDRYGRKLMVERAMFSGAVLISLMGVARSVQQLVLLRAIQGALTGTVTAANALVATTAPRARSGYALGLLQMAIYLGASAGPLLGGFVADSLGYRAAFFITGALLFLAGVGVVLFIREEFHPTAAVECRTDGDRERVGLGRRLFGRVAPVLRTTALLSVMGIRLLMTTGTRLMGPVLPLFVESIVPAGARVATVTGTISGASAAAAAVGALGLGRLGDRIGYRSILIVCALGAAVSYGLQFFVLDSTALLLLQTVSGLAMGGSLASLSASLARSSPEGQEGIVYGVDATLASLANAVGPMAGSALAAWLGLRVPFLVATGVFGVACAVAARLLPGQSHSGSDN
jgi:DHA1 family multidrug resistance protein-like MFS transporter